MSFIMGIDEIVHTLTDPPSDRFSFWFWIGFGIFLGCVFLAVLIS